MGIKSFEDVIAWQKSRDLTVEIYREFGASKDYGFRDQILRASVSIMNNIAEGFDRGSNKELKQFLIIARGSAAEVRSMLLLSREINTAKDVNTYIESTNEISKLLTGFIKSIN